MKYLKKIFLIGLIGVVAPSCVDDTAPEDAFGAGANLASFVSTSSNFTAVATGEEYVMTVPMEVKGPSLESINETITATVSVDASSTAEAGVHYRLDQTTVELKPGNNLLSNLPVTMLTAGIDPPLDEAPVLVLKVSAVTGSGKVIANGKTIAINLLYLCDSQLQGNYIVTILRNDGLLYNYPETIVKIGDGQYRGTSVGHWAPGAIGGNPGFSFVDVCDVITVPEQNLVDLYSNLVYQDGDSYVDPVTGNLHIEYTVTFAAGNRKYICDYVKQ